MSLSTSSFEQKQLRTISIMIGRAKRVAIEDIKLARKHRPELFTGAE